MILQNRLAAHAVTLDAGNTENVQSLSITNVMWTGGPWLIYRGANVVFTTDSTHGDFDFQGHGISIGLYGNATLNVATTAANSTLILRLAKQSITLNPPA